MRPKTLRRRSRLFRKRSRWKLNLALVLISSALAGFVFVDARLAKEFAEAPAHAPASGAATRIAAQRPREALAQASPAASKQAPTPYAAAAATPTAALDGVGADHATALAGDDLDSQTEASAPAAPKPELARPPPADLGSTPSARTTPVSTAPMPTEAPPPAPQPAVLSPREACALIRARTRRVGAEVSFRGEYMSDHRGLTLIRPVGCDQGTGVEVIEASALRRIDRADPPPWSFPSRRLFAQFTARLVQGGEDARDFERDDGVRLSISAVRDVKIVQPASAPRPPARPARPPTPRENCSLCGDDVEF